MLFNILKDVLSGQHRRASTAVKMAETPARAVSVSALPPVLDLTRALWDYADQLSARWSTQYGTTVCAGPFQGMRYHDFTVEPRCLPRILGTYEAELHELLQQFPHRGYKKLLNIGCSSGYYAVGLARLIPGMRVNAYDIEAEACHAASALARLNGVADRVCVEQKLFEPAHFSATADGATLVFMDIEGAEDDLLNEQAIAGLLHTDILLEIHECYVPGLMHKLTSRFQPSHDVEIVERRNFNLLLPEQLGEWSDFDRSLAVCEFRTGPTPWMWARAKTRGARSGQTPPVSDNTGG